MTWIGTLKALDNAWIWRQRVDARPTSGSPPQSPLLTTRSQYVWKPCSVIIPSSPAPVESSPATDGRNGMKSSACLRM